MTENQEFKPYKANYVTGRGGCQFLRDAENHLYVLAEAEYGRWFCRQRRKEMCSGSCYVKNGMVVRSKEHNHPASVTEVTVMVKKAAVLASIDANPQISTSTLVTNLNSACSSVEEHNFLPTNKTFARQIQKKKAKILARPGKPESLDERGQSDEDIRRFPPGGNPILEGTGEIDGSASNNKRKCATTRWERRNTLLHIEGTDKVRFLKSRCDFKVRKDQKVKQTEQDSDSEEEANNTVLMHPNAAGESDVGSEASSQSQGYVFELTSYVKKVAEKTK